MAVADLTEKQYSQLKHANGYTMNCDQWSEEKDNAVNAINNGFCELPDYIKHCETDLEREIFGMFKDIYGQDDVDLSGVEKVISCGFY